MSEQCPTVKVVQEASAENPHGFIVINESDFDSSIHTLVEGENVPAHAVPAAPAPSAYAKLSVPDLVALCDERKIVVPEGTRKAGLVALLEDSE